MAFTPQQQAKMNALRSIAKKRSPLPASHPVHAITPSPQPTGNPFLSAKPGMIPAPTNITNTQQALNNQANVNENDENQLLGS